MGAASCPSSVPADHWDACACQCTSLRVATPWQSVEDAPSPTVHVPTVAALSAPVREFDPNGQVLFEHDLEDLAAKKFLSIVRCATFTEMVDCVEEKATLLNAVNSCGHTALMMVAASRVAHAGEKAEFLIELRARLDAVDERGLTALCHASANRQDVVSSRLIEAGASINHQSDDGMTPVMFAARVDAANILMDLLMTNADLHQRDKKGWTAQLYAAEAGHVDVVLFLAKKKGNPNHMTSCGLTALAMAVDRGDIRLGKSLVKISANVRWQEDNRDSLLMRAIRKGKFAFAHWLLDACVDPSVENLKGETAMSICKNGQLNLRLQKIESDALTESPFTFHG
eukprot:TRINITY_DN18239_c0_g1_i1.p1 TRINITY_DN18239_c0_g1~~TRINITY_DN18239_c0_g1_i1.p1  ORF type:complete len:342 (+),score=56.64 TRINITY_DN18239_c0_g1_i1:114-1139(+)